MLGLMGMPRRVYTYDRGGLFELYNLVSTIGVLHHGGRAPHLPLNVIKSWRSGPRVGNDPWQADTLEWYTTSPPPAHNFDSVPVRDEPAPAPRPAPARRRARDDPRPGPWLRLTALVGAVGAAAVVATGEWGLATRSPCSSTLALLAAPCSSARFGHPDRPGSSCSAGTSFVLFAVGGLVALANAPAWLHVHILGAASLAASVVTALSLPGRSPSAPPAPWRDYVTLTKPRIMSLLLITGAGGLIVGAGGLPSLGLTVATLGGLALACGGATALNHVLDRTSTSS